MNTPNQAYLDDPAIDSQYKLVIREVYKLVDDDPTAYEHLITKLMERLTLDRLTISRGLKSYRPLLK